jgi:hypothetical protein
VSAAGLTGATGPTGPAATGVTGTQGPAGVTGPSLANATVTTRDAKTSADAQKKPTPIKPRFAQFPAELKLLRNWVLWRYLPPKSGGGKWRKVPFQPRGEPARTTDRATWSRFEECCAAYAQGGYDGVGFVFDGEIGADGLCYCGIDFDACVRDGTNVDSLARKRLYLLNTYTEWSVSCTGFHCIARVEPLDRIVKFDGVEVYTEKRFFTFTGRGAGEIKAATAEVRALIAEVRSKEAAAKQQHQVGRSDSHGVSSTELTNSVNNAKPARSFAELDPRDSSLAKGITDRWYSSLSPEQKNEVVDHALGVIARNTQFLELQSNGGNNDQYYNLTVSVARSGAPNAEDIFVKHASTAKNADPDNALRQHFSRCQTSPPSGTQEITVGTLLHTAKERGANFDQWKRQLPGVPPLPPQRRLPLKGGVYSSDEALKLLNSHYLVGKTEQEVGIFRIKDDGSLAFTPPEQFKLDVANISVRTSQTKTIAVEKFWREHPQRHQRMIVFKPDGSTQPDEINLWQGLGVEPRKGRDKMRFLLWHIFKLICRGDKAKFKYLMSWLAWAVQNPGKHPGVVIVLKSRMEGTGKSTLGNVMLKVFGSHGALVEDKDRLLGQFNDWLETICFVLAEEVLWAGDHRTTDRLKSVITSDTIRVERKFGSCRAIPNRLHVIMTTNHEHAVAAGVRDRRYFVLDVSEQRVGDKVYFNRLYQDLDNGGASEFLYLLESLRLGEWHPRQLVKTSEATEQQRMSADSLSQWSHACIDADAIIGAAKAQYGFEKTYNLGTRVPSKDLRNAYGGYCKQHGLRAVNEEVFGKGCTEMFGRRQRLSEQGRRPWGYEVPDGETWQEKLDARLGIKK